MSTPRTDLRRIQSSHVLPAPAQEPEQELVLRPWMLVAAILAVSLVLAFGFLLGHREVDTLQRQLQAAQAHGAQADNEVKTLLAQQPKCDDAQSQLAQVGQFVKEDKLDLASGLAEAKLAQQRPDLCPDAQQALTSLWYNASLDLLFEMPRPEFPNNSLDQQMVTRYLEIERQADGYALPTVRRLAPMSVASRAYSAGLWALSDTAFRRAWAANQAGDVPVSFRYALLRNWGHYLSQQGGLPERNLAVRLLATAQAIADDYHLTGLGEACEDLQGLGYANCREPEPDSTDPVILAAPGKK